MFCDKCGKNIDIKSDKCPYCGAKIIIPNEDKFEIDQDQINNLSKSNMKMKFGFCIGGFFSTYFVISMLGSFGGMAVDDGNSPLWLATFSLIVAILIIRCSYCLFGFKNVVYNQAQMYFSNTDDYNKDEVIKKNLNIACYFNGICAGLWGLLFNYNFNRNKVGYSPTIIGVLNAMYILLLVITCWNNVVFTIPDCFANINNYWPGLLFVFLSCVLIYFGAPFVCTGKLPNKD